MLESQIFLLSILEKKYSESKLYDLEKNNDKISLQKIVFF